MAMGQHQFCTIFWGNEHPFNPFTTYFDVHQRIRVLIRRYTYTHNIHIFIYGIGMSHLVMIGWGDTSKYPLFNGKNDCSSEF